MTTVAARTARLNMRLSPETLDRLRQAAALQGEDLTGFVLSAATDRARQVLRDERITSLSPEGWDALVAALEGEPGVPPPGLLALFRENRDAVEQAMGDPEPWTLAWPERPSAP